MFADVYEVRSKFGFLAMRCRISRGMRNPWLGASGAGRWGNNHFVVGLDLHLQCRATGHPTPQAYLWSLKIKQHVFLFYFKCCITHNWIHKKIRRNMNPSMRSCPVPNPLKKRKKNHHSQCCTIIYNTARKLLLQDDFLVTNGVLLMSKNVTKRS